jgi:hypothetical protein
MSKLGLACLFAFGCLAGCGGDDSNDGSGGGAASDHRQLKDLSQSELVALCKQEEPRLESLADPCAGVGVEQADKASCQAEHDACLKSPMQSGSADSIDCDGANIADLTDCTATVSDFDACFSEVATFAKSLTCDNAGKELKPPACFEQLQTKCPKLFK